MATAGARRRQTYPLNAKNKAHFWKLKILAGLCATWVAAGLAGGLLHRHLGYRMAFVPGAIGLACGAYGLEVCVCVLQVCVCK